jgi:anti-anti-sigma regulatory factor
MTALQLDTWTRDNAIVVVPRGRLGLTTYRQLRDQLIKAGTDNPRAVIVDVTGLDVESAASLSIFSTVHTRLSQWPGVPLLLAAGEGPARDLLVLNRTGRYLPVHDDVSAAVAAIDEQPPRRVLYTHLPNTLISARLAREFARTSCIAWDITQLSDDARLLTGELVSNALIHTSCEPRLRLELRRGLFSVAVYDDVPGDVSVHDPAGSWAGVHGLLLVAQIATAWGCSPTSDGGKVVWATLRVV